MQEIYQKLLEEAEEQNDARGACRILLEMGHHLTCRGKSVEAHRFFQRALERAVALEDPALEERALEPLGIVLLHMGGVEEACGCFQRLLDIVRTAGDRKKEAKILGFLGALDVKQNRLGEASVRLRRASRFLREVQEPYAYHTVLKIRAEVARARGETDQARRLLEECLRMARQADQAHEVEELVSDLAEVYLDLEEPGKARSCLEEGLEISKELDDLLQEACYLLRLSDLDQKAGELLRALSGVRTALDRVERLEDPDLASRATLLLGLVLQDQGRNRAARTALAEAVQRARRAGIPGTEADALTAYAWLLVRAEEPGIHNPHLAIQAATRALDLQVEKTSIPFLVLSKAYRLLGDRNRGRKVIKNAQLIVKK